MWWRATSCSAAPRPADALAFALWDADWSRTRCVAPVHIRRHGAWLDRPAVMLEEDEMTVVDVVVETVRDAATIEAPWQGRTPGEAVCADGVGD